MSGDATSVDGGEASMKNDEGLRIVLVGRTGSGKSFSGNTILGCEAFESKMSPKSVTDRCEVKKGLVAFRNISVVDTPGLFDTRFSEDETIERISDCIHLAAPGPHAFLLVIKLDRFTKEEQRSVEIIQSVFGQESDKYTMVLFTNGDQLKGQPVEAFLKDCPKLQELVSKCKGGYHVFNNETKHPSQVERLMVKIIQMVEENGGSHYTNEMFQEAARKIEEEKERARREMEEKRRAEIEELRKQLREEMREEVREEVKEEVRQEMREEVREEVMEEVKEEVRGEVKEEVRGEVKEDLKKKGKKVKILGIAGGVAAAAGGAAGIAVGVAAFEGAIAGAVGGPIGMAAGALVGLTIGGIVIAVQNRNTNHYKPLTNNNEQPTPEVEED